MSHYNGNNPYPQHGQGEAASYYNDQQQQQQQQQYPQNGQQQQQYPQHGQQQQYDQRNPNGQQGQGFQPDGQDGERGFMGAVGGGLAGGFGGHAVGKKTDHSKLGTVFGVLGGAFAGHKLQDGVSDWKDKRDEKKDKRDEKKSDSDSSDESEKEDKHEKRQEKKNQDRHENSNPRGVKYLGNFSGSSRDMRLDCSGEYTLHASCKRTDGSYQSSSISLNKILSNDRGSFRWVEAEKQDKVTGPRQFTVQQGHTLREIAKQVGGSFEEIARANGIQNPDQIYPGQVLNIPGAAFETSGSNGGGVGNFGNSARNVELVDGGRRVEGELLRDGQWVGSTIVLDERIGNDNGTLTFKS